MRAIDACVDFTAKLVNELNIPPLSKFSMTPASVTEMVSLARKSSSMRFNPIVLSDAALSNALIAAIHPEN